MSWKTIGALSTYGVLIGVALVLGLVHQTDLIVYRLSFILISALWIGSKIAEKPLLHGFLVGIISEVVTWGIVFIFFTSYTAHNSSQMAVVEKYYREFLLLYGLVTGVTVGFFIGALSWVTADLRPYLQSVYLRTRQNIKVAPLKPAVCVLAALLSFLASLFFSGIVLVSCAGHPPFRTPRNNVLGLIISVFLIWACYRLGKMFLKAAYNPKVADNANQKDLH
jgi:hypothetical protein